MTPERAEEVALLAFQHVTEHQELLERFMALSGMDVDTIRNTLSDPALWMSSFEFLREHESDCAAFALNHGLSSEDMQKAAHILENPH